MDKIIKFLDGKKTYIVLSVSVILGAIDSYNSYCEANSIVCHSFSVPPFIYSTLAMLGIYTRSQVKK